MASAMILMVPVGAADNTVSAVAGPVGKGAAA